MRVHLVQVLLLAGACATYPRLPAEGQGGPEEQSGECSWVVHFADGGCVATVTTNMAEPAAEAGTFDVYYWIGRTYGACGQKFEACGAGFVCKCPATPSRSR